MNNINNFNSENIMNKNMISNNNNYNKNMNQLISNMNNLNINKNAQFIQNNKNIQNYENNEEIIKEAHIDGHLYSMSLQTMKFFCRQMECSIFKILKKNNISGTGFICKINSKDNLKKTPVIITCSHVLNENDLALGKEIHLIFNNIKHVKIIINKLRKIYVNNDYDISIIEIKNNDDINENNLLELDENIYNQNIYNIYRGKQIYILHIPKGNEINYSTEKIRNINISKGELEHFCSTDGGSSGAPIFNFETRKVMGMHQGYNATKKVNLGITLNNPIEEFYKSEEKIVTKNEIILNLEINKEHINKNIYFLII